MAIRIKKSLIKEKDHLFNRVVEEFENASTFFPNSMSDDTVGKHISMITACLWYLDGSTAKIMERSAHLVDVKPLPERYTIKTSYWHFNR